MGGVDEDEVSEDKAAEDEVEIDCCGLEAGEEDCEGYRGKDDAGEEGSAVVMMEVVAGFECVLVEEAVGGVERPDG